MPKIEDISILLIYNELFLSIIELSAPHLTTTFNLQCFVAVYKSVGVVELIVTADKSTLLDKSSVVLSKSL